MRTAESSYVSTSELGRPELSPVVNRDAVLTVIGTLALATIAVIHLVQIVPTFKATPLLGGGLVLVTAGAVALAARLVVRSDSPTWAAARVLSVGAIAGYVLTRAVNTPLDTGTRGTGPAFSASPHCPWRSAWWLLAVTLSPSSEPCVKRRRWDRP